MNRPVGDIEVGYSECGAGAPVVLIHGLAEDRCSWSAVQDRLSDFHTYAYDLRGHGETDVGNADGTLAQLGGDLIRFLESVSGASACVGYSLGGTVVLWAALERPDLIPHAIVTGTSTVVGKAAVGFFRDRIRSIEADFSAFAAALRDDTAAQIVAADIDLDAITARRLEAIGDGRGYVNAACAMLGLHEQPLTPRLSGLHCPVDVIAGAGDVFCPRKAANIMLGALVNGTYHEIANCGHLMSVDQPEAYAETLATVLGKNPR
ncbi:MAG: alpha/beta fold hydrolase [Gammaproteobacteria bacterium]